MLACKGGEQAKWDSASRLVSLNTARTQAANNEKP